MKRLNERQIALMRALEDWSQYLWPLAKELDRKPGAVAITTNALKKRGLIEENLDYRYTLTLHGRAVLARDGWLMP